MTSILDLSAVTLEGQIRPLADFRGQALLIVNTASKCGYTPQFQGLEKLYRTHKERGFSVLGFPCNQFANQEPGNSLEIVTFCSTIYGVTFPMFAKIDVNGPNTHPVYKLLKRARPGFLGTQSIKWNFTKFLVNRAGEPVARFGSRVEPEALEAPILRLL